MPMLIEYGNTGKIIEFPDGTDTETIQKAMSQLSPQGNPRLRQGTDGVSFLDSVKAGVFNLGGASQAFRTGLNDLMGDEESEAAALQSYNQNREKVGKLLSEATDWRDIGDADSVGEGFSRTLDFVKEQFGLNSPQMATIMAGGFGMSAAAPYLPNPLATAVGKVGAFGVGSVMVALPMFTGFNIGRQLDEGQDPDFVKASAYAIPAAATEAILAGVLSKTGLTSVGSKLLGEATPSMIGKMGAKIGEALAVGVPGEVIQQGLERASADLDLTSEEAFDEYLDAAIASVAALAPMGAVTGALGTSPGELKRNKRTKEEEAAMLVEAVDLAPIPKQNIFKTPEEASKALLSIGIDPTIFTPEARVKAANSHVDKVDAERMKLIEAQIPAGSDLRSLITQPTMVDSPLKNMVNNKMEVPSNLLETSKISDIASVYPQSEKTASSYRPSIIDSGASTAVLAAQGSLTRQTNEKRFTTPQISELPTFTEIPGQIMADMDRIGLNFRRDISGKSKEDLIKMAKEEYGIPDSELKNADGRYIKKSSTKADAEGEPTDVNTLEMKIFEKFVERQNEFIPKIRVKTRGDKEATRPVERIKEPLAVQPLNRISETDLSNLDKILTPAKPKPEVVKQMKPVVDQFKRIAKENNLDVNIQSDLKVDGKTKEFSTPVKAARAGNFMFTVSNFNNTVDYPNMDSHLQEVWHYMYDKMPKSVKDTVLAELPSIEKSLESVDNLHIRNIQRYSEGPVGQQEIFSSLFAEYAQAKREGRQSEVTIAPKTKAQFNKIIRTLEKSKEATKGLGLNTFESIFPQVSEEGITPRDAVFESVDRLRDSTLMNLSNEMKFTHWDSLNKVSIKSAMDDAIKTTKLKNARDTAFKDKALRAYAQSMFASISHAASKSPIISIAYNLRRQQEIMQTELMNEFSETAQAYFREGSQEVRNKAGDIMDLLRNTDQQLRRDNSGAIIFEREGKMVRISNPEMIKVIDSLDMWGKKILSRAEVDIRTSINELAPGLLTSPMSEIKKTIEQMSMDKSVDKENLSFLKEQFAALEDVNKMKTKPFMPHMRFGAFGFTVHAKENLDAEGKVKAGAKPIYHDQVEKGGYQGRWDKDQYMKVQKKLQKFRDDPAYSIREDSKSRPYEMEYDQMYDYLSKEGVTLEVLAGLLGSDKTQDYYVDVKNKIDNKTKFRGYSKRFAESKDIDGYSKDWDRVMASYNMGAAHFFAKAKFAPKLQEYANALNSSLNSDIHSKVVRQTQDYIEHTNSPHDDWQGIRQLNFLWTMGGNASTAMLQYMTLPTTSLGSMAQYNPNPLQNMRRLQRNFNIAFKELPKISHFENGAVIVDVTNPKFLQILRDKYKFSDQELKAVVSMFKRGVTGQNMMEESAGKKDYNTTTTRGKFKTQASKATHLAGFMIGGMEQITRFSTYMSHYQMFLENPKAVERAMKVLKDDYRFQTQIQMSGRPLIEDLAAFGVDEAHAVFGKVGRGELLRGGLGAFVFPFMTYPQNAVEFMTRLGGRGKEGRQALLLTGASLMMFSGLIGLPGAELLKEMYEEIHKGVTGEELDLDAAIREVSLETTGSARPGIFLTQGIFRAVLNMDVARRVGLPIVGQDIILGMMGVRGDMTDLLGVQGSMLSQGIAAWDAYKTDSGGLKMSSLLSPVAISNVLKAATYFDEGVRTAGATQLISKKEVNENPFEAVFRALGITTGRVASAREAEYWKLTENNKVKPKMNSFRAKGKNYMTKLYEAQQEGNEEKASLYREKYVTLLKDVSEYMTKKERPYDMAAFNRSVMEALGQRIQGETRYKDYSKNVRHRKDVVDEISGRNFYDKDE